MTVISDILIPARAPWSGILRAGQSLRIIDLDSQQAVDALFYNAADPSERYCAQTTLAAQAAAGGTYYLAEDAALLSNEGRTFTTPAPAPARRRAIRSVSVPRPASCTPAGRIFSPNWRNIISASATSSPTSISS
jgi:uncharacterized protein YcgI (DUF1989 family)